MYPADGLLGQAGVLAQAEVLAEAGLLAQADAWSWFESLSDPVALAVLVAASIAGAWLVATVGVGVARRLTRGTRTTLDDAVLDAVRWPATVTIGVAGVYVAADAGLVATATGDVLRAAVLSVVAVAWASALVRVGSAVLNQDSDAAAVHSEFAPIFQNLWTFVVLVGSGAFLLWVWGIEITPLLASAGIAGIAVGFAAKDTVANFFGSIALYVDGTYAVGDYVELDTGVSGTVVDISIRSTRILTRENVLVTVPNSVLNASQIANQSAPVGKKRITVPVGVAYDSDLDAVENCLLDAAREEDLVVRSPEPRTRLRGFGDSAVEYELLCWVKNPLHDARAVHQLNRAIHQRFRDAGVEIPFPQRVLRTENDAAADASLSADVAEKERSGRPSA